MEAGRDRYITISLVNLTASLSKQRLIKAVAPEGNSQGSRFWVFTAGGTPFLLSPAAHLFRQQRQLVSIAVEVGESLQLADAPRQVLKRQIESVKLACFYIYIKLKNIKK